MRQGDHRRPGIFQSWLGLQELMECAELTKLTPGTSADTLDGRSNEYLVEINPLVHHARIQWKYADTSNK